MRLALTRTIEEFKVDLRNGTKNVYSTPPVPSQMIYFPLYSKSSIEVLLYRSTTATTTTTTKATGTTKNGLGDSIRQRRGDKLTCTAVPAEAGTWLHKQNGGSINGIDPTCKFSPTECPLCAGGLD